MAKNRTGTPGSENPSDKAKALAASEKPGSRSQHATDIRDLQGGYRGVPGAATVLGSREGAIENKDDQAKMIADSKQILEEKAMAAEKDGGGTGARKPAQVMMVDPFTDRLPFNCWVTIVVTINVVLVGLEQEEVRKSSDSGEATLVLWGMLAMIMCCLFWTELLVRISFRRGAFFRDIWDLLDTLLCTALLVDAFILVPAGKGGAIRLFSSLRMMRAVKLVRLVRSEKMFRELWLLLGGFVNSLKALGWVGIVVIVAMYTTSIVVTVQIGQNDIYEQGPSYDGTVWPYKEYFGSVFKSMFTMFQIITLDGWSNDIVRHVVYRQPIMFVFFGLYLVLMSFGLINIIVGIIVENTIAAGSVADVAQEEKESFKKKQAIAQLFDALVRSNPHRTGVITKEEFMAIAESDIVTTACRSLGVNFDEMRILFEILDYTKTDRVELNHFISCCKDLCGTGKLRDIAQLEMTVGSLGQSVETLESRFMLVESELGGLNKLTDDFIRGTVQMITGFQEVT